MNKISGFAAGIVGCALLGASAARADYAITIDQVGPDIVVTGSGSINTLGLTQPNPGVTFAGSVSIQPTSGLVGLVVPGSVLLNRFAGPMPAQTIGPGPSLIGATGGITGSTATPLQFQGAGTPVILLPVGYLSGTFIGPTTATYLNTTVTPRLTPGTYQWTWGGGGPSTDQSVTITVVPGPIVGAGLPGLIAALGGLVAMARRRRKQLA